MKYKSKFKKFLNQSIRLNIAWHFMFILIITVMTIGLVCAESRIKDMRSENEHLREVIKMEYQALKAQYPRLTYEKYCIIKNACRKYESAVLKRSGGKIKPDIKLICGVIKEESDFSSTAISSSGAAGDMQLMPGTARDLHVTDRTNPAQNIDGGIRHLYFTCLPKSGGDMQRAIALYNCGQNKKWKDIPKQSKRYASRCMRNYQKSTGYMLAML